MKQLLAGVLVLTSWAFGVLNPATAQVFEYSYPGSDKSGELIYPVRHILWIPPGLKTVRGIIVHQHGCGEGACKGGATAAFDLHWRELARRNDCALLGPTYSQKDKDDCRKWCDPRNGSEAVFLAALEDLAKKSGHPEIAKAPWCLWGHSGGGFWASILMARHPGRIVAVWCRSGTAYPVWTSGQIPKVDVPKETYGIPVVMNPGFREKGDKRFDGAWTGAEAMFAAWRKNDAPALFAPDPRSAHDCGDSRYLAIPWFDACLKARLGPDGSLKPIDSQSGFWVGPDNRPIPANEFKGELPKAGWIPGKAVADAFVDYVISGTVADLTPPPAPRGVNVRPGGMPKTLIISWEADADFESGIRAFEIRKNGKMIATLPEKPVATFGRPLFQGLSYHDTPNAPLPPLEYKDLEGGDPSTTQYEVITINSAGLRSKAGKP